MPHHADLLIKLAMHWHTPRAQPGSTHYANFVYISLTGVLRRIAPPLDLVTTKASAVRLFLPPLAGFPPRMPVSSQSAASQIWYVILFPGLETGKRWRVIWTALQ